MTTDLPDFEGWPTAQGTGDDTVLCHLCGTDLALVTLIDHLRDEHDIDPAIVANAPIIDLTGED